MIFSKPKHALVTVSTPSFLTGTMVMIHSFLQHNRWFGGDIIIIHEDLTNNEKQLLAHFPKVIFQPVNSKILDAVRDLVPEYPDFERRKAQFYSLEMLRINRYEHIIFMDSDTVFTGSIEELMERPEPLLCVGTVNVYRPKGEGVKNPFAIEVFNAGMMRIHKRLLGEKTFQTMVSLISASFFRKFLDYAQENGLPRVGTDQIILNTIWADQLTLVSAKFNYRLGIEKEILARDNVGCTDAVVLHFTGDKKPWMLDRTLFQITGKGRQADMFIRWHQAFRDMLQDLRQT